MISRKTNRYTYNQESLHQSSFTAMKGIDCSKAPTSQDTVLSTTNLDVDYDGGLILRKPLILKDKLHTVYISKMSYMYDKETMLQISPDSLMILKPSFAKSKFTDIYGKQHTFSLGLEWDSVWDYTNANIQNTATTTLVTNVVVDLQGLENAIKKKSETSVKLYNSNVEPSVQIRMLKFYKEDYSWVFEMLTPEPATVTTEPIPVDFNTALHNRLALRDNYYASHTSINGILAYVQDSDVYEPVEGSVTFNYDFDSKDTSTFHQYTFSADKSNALPTHMSLVVRNPKLYFNDQYPNRMLIDVWVAKMNVFRKASIEFSYIDHNNGVWHTNSKSLTITDTGIDVSEHGSQRALIYLGFDINDEYFKWGVDDWFTYSITVKYTYDNTEALNRMSVDKLTESKDVRILNTVDHTGNDTYVVLKAFFNKPNLIPSEDELPLVVKWERSSDGITWTNLIDNFTGTEHTFQVSCISEEISDNLTDDDGKTLSWYTDNYYPLDLPDYENVSATVSLTNSIPSYTDDSLSGISFTPIDFTIETLKYPVTKRIDCLVQRINDDTVKYMYRCTLAKIKNKSNSSTAPTGYVLDYILDQKLFNFNISSFSTVSDDFKNPLTGNMLYWKHSLWAYGNGLGSTIYVSDPDSAVFPMSRIIDLGTYQTSDVVKIIPWRDYIVAFTKHSVHLIQEQEVGFTTKVINTFVGVPEIDADTCVSILNGIVFKSGSKVYSLMPNYGSGVDTILNITEISKPIQHLLEPYTKTPDTLKNFAFTTSENYYLCIIDQGTTVCFKYNYTSKLWTQHILPIRVRHYDILKADDIRLFDETLNSEYYFEKDSSTDDVYGDIIRRDVDGNDIITPIKFSVDSGQKTDNISLTKQFVESKIIVATLSAKDNFKMDVRVDIEGNTFKKHTDLNTDGALLRGSADDILTLGSNLDTDTADTFNVMRQMFLRYSGKGKTVRHVITGESLYKFKIYEVFYRYKLLNFKQ